MERKGEAGILERYGCIPMKIQAMQITEEKSLEKRGYQNPLFIGRGTYAAVYRVKHVVSGAFYACKMSSVEGLWKREQEILEQLRHSLFPAYKESWQESGRYFLIMEYVPGQTLERLLQRRGCLMQQRAVKLGISLAEGLTYLEELPDAILFRDLKAENVRIREDGRLKLLDLGCACPAKLSSRTFAGTVGYAAPEQLAPSGKAGAYSDVYAFGKLLHYMLTGDNPCLPPIKKHKIRAYNKNLSVRLERLVEQCIQEEPKERLPDMRCVLRRLYDVASEGQSAGSIFDFFVQKAQGEEFLYEKNVFKSGSENEKEES
ncbi:MAG: serine/threonine protein kinase [Lachnoclostridium sp.]|nr:serine/threonine protein kinase [Lachnospira sp.]MCM1247070.1 serine/threonine protein kinase [Lachnoclostridium sp.]MCM1534778.1 serine/threonine protein kinase [Clostridium sp.]